MTRPDLEAPLHRAQVTEEWVERITQKLPPTWASCRKRNESWWHRLERWLDQHPWELSEDDREVEWALAARDRPAPKPEPFLPKRKATGAGVPGIPKTEEHKRKLSEASDRVWARRREEGRTGRVTYQGKHDVTKKKETPY